MDWPTVLCTVYMSIVQRVHNFSACDGWKVLICCNFFCSKLIPHISDIIYIICMLCVHGGMCVVTSFLYTLSSCSVYKWVVDCDSLHNFCLLWSNLLRCPHPIQYWLTPHNGTHQQVHCHEVAAGWKQVAIFLGVELSVISAAEANDPQLQLSLWFE